MIQKYNPAYLLGIQIVMGIFSDIPQIAVFNTVSHPTIPKFAYTYPIPMEHIDQKISMVSVGQVWSMFQPLQSRSYNLFAVWKERMMERRKVALILNKLIVVHLGNGASIVTTAVN